LYIKGKDYKTVFILGAGATRGAIKHVLLNGKRLKPPLNSDFFKVAETYARASKTANKNRLMRLKKFFKDGLSEKNLSMEDAFSILYIAKNLQNIYAAKRGPRRETGDLKEIEDFLQLAFGIFAALDQNYTDSNNYDKLVEKLTENDTIISLNYDTLLDSALHRHGWNPQRGYCLTGTKNKIKWKSLRTDQVRYNLSNVNLLKLHGSVNWFVKGTFKNLQKVFENKPAKVTEPRKNEISGYIRQIIPPIFGKFFNHKHWESLWGKAYEALKEAEVFVIIGNSLINTDFHLRALLGRMKNARKNSFKYLILVDKTRIRNKWLKVLKGRFQKMKYYTRFEKFVIKEN
jgi:NAD-dependent SIR2 family protein deacetylase